MSYDDVNDCELNPDSSHECQLPSPPGGSATQLWPKREYVSRRTSIPRDFAFDANHPGDDETLSHITERKEQADQRDPRSTQIERLLVCAYRAPVFRNAEGLPVVLIPGESIDQFDVASLHSRDFATFLREEYHKQHHHFPKEALLGIVRDLLDRRVSHRDGSSTAVALRVAYGHVEHAGEPGQPQRFRQVVALDLGRHSPTGPDSVLEIDADGWSVNHSSGFAFLRPRGQHPLPLPEPAGPQALTELKHLFRVDDPDWLRILTWLLSAMHPAGPYPILRLQGEAGSGKSQAAKMIKLLLDPAAVPFQPLPTNPNTVLRQATQTWIQVFDHITGMPKQISTVLCRLSTGAGFSLPGDPRGSPTAVSLARPILMTVPTADSGAAWKPPADLLDRMLTITLPPLTADTTRPESEIAARFLKARPRILGALAQAVSVAMQRVDQVQLGSYPRNAQAAVWAIAASPALNVTPESLQQALAQKTQFQICNEPLLQKLAALMATREDWQGTATELRLELNTSDAPNHLSRKLKQVQTILQAQGIEISFPPRQENGQTIRITKAHKIKVEWNSRSEEEFPVGSVDSTI